MYRSITSVTLFLLATLSNAQTIDLPVYHEGQHELDTVYTYYGPLAFSGIGSVSLGGTLASNFVTGVDFKMVVDSTNQGSSPSHAAFRDSMGVMVSMYKGDTLELPANFQLFAGEVGFHIIIEGIPSIAAEPYLCDLGYAFTLGNDWEMGIFENTQTICYVDLSSGIQNHEVPEMVHVYPNPFNRTATLVYSGHFEGPYELWLTDLLGNCVRIQSGIFARAIRIERDDLAPGSYALQLWSEGRPVAKKIIVID